MRSAFAPYLLDTCVLSHVVKRRRDGGGWQYPAMVEELALLMGRDVPVFISVVTLFEIERGYAKQSDVGLVQRDRLLRVLEACTILPVEPRGAEAGACRRPTVSAVF